MRILPVLLVLCGIAAGAAQDDVARAVDRLGSDDVSERDRAARDLERLGPAAVERLEKARDAATDPEVKGRLTHIVRSIRKREEFAKVFGETRRVTLEAKARRVDEVATELGKALGEKIRLEGLDPSGPVDLSLREASLWEALDSLARSARAHYEYGSDVVFRPGRADFVPAHYAQQFRVAITEIQRLDYRAPAASGEVLLFTLELSYQRNMKPLTDSARERFSIESVTEAGGKAVRADQPEWANSMSFNGLPHGVVHSFFARADAAAPLTVTGTTAVPFAYETKEIRLALEGEGKTVREGAITLTVSGFSETAAGVAVSVRGKAADGSDVRIRLGEGEACLLDAEGGRHRLLTHGGGGSSSEWLWNFEGGLKADRARALILPWITRLHWVEIPFRFEGVQVPPP